MSQPARKLRRRSRAFRRLLFWGLIALLLPPGLAGSVPQIWPAIARDQEAPRLAAREVRVTRTPSGGYRILEIIDLAPGSRDEGPLALVELPEEATRFAAAGPNIEPTDVLLDASTVSILRWPAGVDPVQVLISYQLPERAAAIEFVSLLETEAFGISLARGSVHARVDPRLERAGEVGSAASPRRRFATSELESGTVIAVGLDSTRVGWRERLAVLIAAALAVALGAVWVWRH